MRECDVECSNVFKAIFETPEVLFEQLEDLLKCANREAVQKCANREAIRLTKVAAILLETFA